ncbi:MAG: glycosyltransferase [Nanoarchaeota archaeon]|nr:MAG: glycosyltransferase [Nanoarchaeota archaeon]
MPTITFGMIAKNEEKFLPACLESVKDIVDEIIVVDTGSTDKTVQIAESYGAKVIHHKWQLNMSKARDEYIKAATKEWILSLDADERFAKQDVPKIKSIIEQHPNVMGFFFVKRDYGFAGVKRSSDDPYEESQPFDCWMEVREIRLFKNDKRLHYTHHVHTNLIPSIQKLKGVVADVDGLPIHHFRQQLTSEQKAAKRKLYLQMLEMEVIENPTDPSAYGHLAVEYGPQDPNSIKNYEKAVELIKKNKESGKNPWSYHFAIVGQLGMIYMEQKKLDKAKELFKLAAELNSTNPQDYSSLGEIEYFQKDYKNAHAHFIKARDLGHKNSAYINARLNALSKELGLNQIYF